MNYWANHSNKINFVYMERILVTIENPDKVDDFLRVTKKIGWVHSVEVVSEKKTIDIPEGEELYNWILPTRPASVDEIDQLIKDMEIDEKEGDFMTGDEARAQSLSKIGR